MLQPAPSGGFVRAGIVCALFLVAAANLAGAADQSANREEDLARPVLDATGVRGGLIVHLGCGDGRLTAALRAGEGYLVQGLETDAEKVRRARERVRLLGLYGPVSIERFDGAHLPYADNLVNLVVTDDLGGVAREEVMRVLAPGGALCLRQDGRWQKTVKPHPKNTDEWTHYLHDASGNPVAHDALVGPPRYVQWLAGPRHSRSHEYTPSTFALVSSGGRIFYVADEAPVASIRKPAQWFLVARDAYNGVLLWKRPIPEWFPQLCGWTQQPVQLQRKLVAIGDRVYVTLGYYAPLSALDAATGKTLAVYDDTAGAEEVVWHRGTLLLVVRKVSRQRTAELAKWERLAKQKDTPLGTREGLQPIVSHFRAVENKAETAIVAVDAKTGRERWAKTGPDAARLRPLSLCADGDRVFYQAGREVVCLDLKTGHQWWSVLSAPLRVVCGRAVICADKQTVTALSVQSGEPLWSQPLSLCQVRDAFVVGDSLWLGGFRPYDTGRKHTGPPWGPYFATQRDLATGKILKQIEPQNPGHHHRCFVNKATDRYILGGRRGVEFIDLATGDVRWHSWVRGVCRYGVMPCNGLLYAPPHACGCYITAKLTGFYALANQSSVGTATSASAAKLPSPSGRGAGGEGSQNVVKTSHPAAESRPSPKRSKEDWPTYRHDAARSGSTPCLVPTVLRRRWEAAVGGKLTSPTVADGKVFVAAVDEHRLLAVDADSGRPAWQFTAGARVDSPPTLHQGRAIFGCRDGCVYSVRTADGALAWRVRAARRQRHIVACGQVESASPVFGSVLLEDSAVWVTAGRSSYLDGGIDLCRIEPQSGNVLSRTPIYSPDPKTGKQPAQFGPNTMPGALADVLVGDGRHVYLRNMVFDKHGRAQAKGSPHLLTLTGFLDDSWAHRSYWIFGTHCSLATGCSGRERNLVYGRLLVFDRSTVYGYGRKTVHWSNQLEDGPYRLFAIGRGETRKRWTRSAAMQVRAMALAGEVLLAAGPRAGAGDGGSAGLLVAVSASDGAELARYPLDTPPVFDGMAVAGGRLYVALEGGQLVCLDGTSE